MFGGAAREILSARESFYGEYNMKFAPKFVFGSSRKEIPSQRGISFRRWAA